MFDRSITMLTGTEKVMDASVSTEKHPASSKCQRQHVEGGLDQGMVEDVGNTGMDPALHLKILKVNEVSVTILCSEGVLTYAVGGRQDWLDKLPLETVLSYWIWVCI